MQDRRISKTKKNLKNALISLLDTSSFDKIKVKDICAKAEISRNTYYAYYNDKYSLLDEIFHDAGNMAYEKLLSLQASNNADDDAYQGYLNLLCALLDMFSSYRDFFIHAADEENPYMSFSSHMYIFHYVEDFAKKYEKMLKPRYSTQRTMDFLCNGLLSFIQQSYKEGIGEETIREESETLLTDFLRSDYFKAVKA